MSLLTVQTLSPELMKLLGIPPYCSSFELRCAVGEIVSVKCEFHPRGDAGVAAAIGAVLGEYELVRRPSAATTVHPAEAMGFDAWMRQRTEGAHDAYMVRMRGMAKIERAIFVKRIYDPLYKSMRPRVLEIAGIF